MTTTRLEPNWFIKRLAQGLSLEEIGYLVGLINECTSLDRRDLTAHAARHLAEVHDVDAILDKLATAEQVAWVGGRLVVYGAKPSRPYKATISDGLRERVYARDGYACLACGATDDLACDHIVPEVKGGVTEMDNLQTLCRACNSRKGVETIDYRGTPRTTGALPVPRGRTRTLAEDDPRHGTNNAYTNLRCRCARCKAAGTAARKGHPAVQRA